MLLPCRFITPVNTRLITGKKIVILLFKLKELIIKEKLKGKKMKSKKMFLVLFCFLFIHTGFTAAQENQEFIKRGDEFYEKWEHKNALAEYMKAYNAVSTDYEVLWRIARGYTDRGEKIDERVRESYYQNAMDFAEKAVLANPDGVEGHFRKAVALGRLALFKGGKTKIELSKGVKTEIDIVKQLDPDYDLAYYVIGRWHREIANLSRVLKALAKVIYGGVPEASNEKAIENFTRAVELNPDYVEYRLEFGRTYVMLKEWELAREQLNKCVELPSEEEDDDSFKEEARQMLNKIKNKK